MVVAFLRVHTIHIFYEIFQIFIKIHNCFSFWNSLNQFKFLAILGNKALVTFKIHSVLFHHIYSAILLLFVSDYIYKANIIYITV